MSKIMENVSLIKVVHFLILFLQATSTANSVNISDNFLSNSNLKLNLSSIGSALRQEPHSISKPRLDSLNSLDEKPDPHEGFTFLPSFIADWLDDIKQSRDQDDESCKEGDLTNHFALILQGALGFISFGVLILKRLCEPEETRRTWTIWFLDTSKQGLGMMFMHVINVYLSETNSNKNADPCTFYLTSFILDTTVGLCIIWALMKSSEHIVTKYKILGGLPFGEYERYSYALPDDAEPYDQIVVPDEVRITPNPINESENLISGKRHPLREMPFPFPIRDQVHHTKRLQKLIPILTTLCQQVLAYVLSCRKIVQITI